MSKYKKGDKFIFEIVGVIERKYSEDEQEYLCKAKKEKMFGVFEHQIDEFNKFDETKTYEQGLADAWEATRKIILSYKDYSALKPTDFKEVFGTVAISEVLEKFTAAEAMARIKEHEEKQVINVGDEIIDSNGDIFIVTHIFADCLYGISQNGLLSYTSNKKIKKTGRHFPQLEEMFKEMKE